MSEDYDLSERQGRAKPRTKPTRQGREKLLDRIKAPAYRFAARVRAIIHATPGLVWPQDHNRVAQELRDKRYPPGQWHRWYKVNRARQRRLTALKQLGMKIHPHDTGLWRGMVK